MTPWSKSDEAWWQQKAASFPGGVVNAIWHMPDSAAARMAWLEGHARLVVNGPDSFKGSRPTPRKGQIPQGNGQLKEAWRSVLQHKADADLALSDCRWDDAINHATRLRWAAEKLEIAIARVQWAEGKAKS